MNKLSLILYFGNVAANCAPLFVIIGLIMAALCVTFTVRMYVERSEILSNGRYMERDEFLKKRLPKVSFGGILCGVMAFVFWGCATFIPSQETVYAIAASQMGQEALKTPLASKAEKALESWLDRQMAPSPPAESK